MRTSVGPPLIQLDTLCCRHIEPGARGGGSDEAALPAAAVPRHHVGTAQRRRGAGAHPGDHAGRREAFTLCIYELGFVASASLGVLSLGAYSQKNEEIDEVFFFGCNGRRNEVMHASPLWRAPLWGGASCEFGTGGRLR